MTTATQLPGAIILYTGGLSPTVEVTLNGADATLFSDAACTESQANPFTATEDTTVYVTDSGTYTVSAKVNGVELLGGDKFVRKGDTWGQQCAANTQALVQALAAGGGSSQSVIITDPNDIRVAVSGTTYIYNPTSAQPQVEVTDAVLTNGSPTLSSATGGFLGVVEAGNILDDGTNLGGAGVIPIGTTVLSVDDDNTVTMSANATGDADPDTVNVGFGALLQVPAAVGTEVAVFVTKASGGGVLIGTSPPGGDVAGAGGLDLLNAGCLLVLGDDGTNVGTVTLLYRA